MRNKGFTLIELLAVIVILAIKALIATPIILNIIKESKESSDERSIDLYLHTIELEVARKNLTQNFNPIECTVEKNGDLMCGEINLKIDMKGIKPNSGTIKLNNQTISQYKLILNGKEYTNIKSTPEECFEAVDNGDGTATITGYLCGGTYVNYGEDIIDSDYMDVIIPETIEAREITNATLNINKCITKFINDGITEDEAIENCNGFKEEFNQLSLEEKIEFIYQNQEYKEIFDIEYLDNEKKLPVTKISRQAFDKNVSTYAIDLSNIVVIYSVVFPDTIINIDDCTFYYNQLKSVKFGNGLTSIGESAFKNNQLTSVVIPNNVSNIGEKAFDENQLTSVKINAAKDKITIGNQAFGNYDLSKIEWAS